MNDKDFTFPDREKGEVAELEEVTPKILEKFRSQAYAAHSNTSFSPGKRAESMVNDYSEELEADLQELRDGGAGEEAVESYRIKYEQFFSSYLGAKSRCFSVMITGGSNFPVRRHEKANRSEHRHYEVFREWRQRAKKAIIRKAGPEKTFLSEIDRYKNDLEGMKRNHDLMKKCNVIIKKAKGKDCTSELVAAGLSESNARKIQLPDFAGRIGFASFNLTNNNANMKRVEERIKVLEAKEKRAVTVKEERFPFPGGEVILNHEEDRLQIKHDNKPSREELTAMKAKGLSSFNWSPSNMAWQMKISNHAIRKANDVTGANVPWLRV